MTTTDTTGSTTDQETILRRIRALLDQAESTPYPDEAETFAAKAAELMARYHVDAAMLHRRSGDPHRIVELDILLGRGQYVRARLLLLGEVADAFGCRLLSSSTPEGRVGHVIGHADDTERVSLMYTSLLLQATRAADAEPGPRGHRQVTFRRGFLIGFALKVGERLRAQVAEAVRDTPSSPPTGPSTCEASVALVLADRRHAVDSWIEGHYPRIGRLAPASPVRGDALERGALAGQRADLGDRRMPGPRRALRR
jgi:hypothetical protein